MGLQCDPTSQGHYHMNNVLGPKVPELLGVIFVDSKKSESVSGDTVCVRTRTLWKSASTLPVTAGHVHHVRISFLHYMLLNKKGLPCPAKSHTSQFHKA